MVTGYWLFFIGQIFNKRIISIKVGVKAEIKQIHFNLLGHGLARIHTDSLNDFRLRRMGTCAIADPSKLQAEDLERISQTEIPWCHVLTPKAKKYSF
jgi:hypothetical protein